MEKDSGKGVSDHEGGSWEEEEKVKESCKVEAESAEEVVPNNSSAPTTDFEDSKKHPKKEFPSKKKESSHSSVEKTQEDQDDSDSTEPTGDQDDYVFVELDEKRRSNAVVDLATLVSPSWLKTDKRGRRSVGAYAAAETLTYLKNLFKGASQSEVRTISSNVGDNDNDTDTDTENDTSNSLNAQETTGKLKDRVGHSDERKKKGIKKSEKWVLVRSPATDLESENENKNKPKLGDYKCFTCGVSFSTYKGLREHTLIHKESNTETVGASRKSDDVSEENNSSDSSKMDEASWDEETSSDEACQSTGTKPKD
ncbi:hypothetical protein VNO77_17666 [Canavalia gladiata]|uniref:C2H2-type domain-containing protein n=1 Tax=Canavalia gladiata TaxID=3824 RepID=A0AAN9LJE3_CANGL